MIQAASLRRATAGYLEGAVAQHGAGHREEAIADGAQAAPMGVALLAEGLVAGAAQVLAGFENVPLLGGQNVPLGFAGTGSAEMCQGCALE